MTIESERSGMSINRSLVKDLLKMLLSINVYRAKFEAPFLASSSATFKTEGLTMMADLNVTVFLQHVQKRLSQANEMVTNYLDSNTKSHLVGVIEDNLFTPHAKAITLMGFDGLMDEERVDILTLFYKLMERVSKIDDLREALLAYVKTKVGSMLGSEVKLDEERRT